ncbi:hypothetical protein R6Q59_006374 [Mikania micrantha]
MSCSNNIISPSPTFVTAASISVVCNTLLYRDGILPNLWDVVEVWVATYVLSCPIFLPDMPVQIKRMQRLVKKDVDPIITKDDMSNAPKTYQAHCPNCGHNKASYIQFQTRSADEPMTTNFTCEKCSHCWRED